MMGVFERDWCTPQDSNLRAFDSKSKGQVVEKATAWFCHSLTFAPDIATKSPQDKQQRASDSPRRCWEWS